MISHPFAVPNMLKLRRRRRRFVLVRDVQRHLYRVGSPAAVFDPDRHLIARLRLVVIFLPDLSPKLAAGRIDVEPVRVRALQRGVPGYSAALPEHGSIGEKLYRADVNWP